MNYELLTMNCLYADFEVVNGGARSSGLSGAFTALADDNSAIFYNPAGLAQIKKSRLSCGYRKLFINLYDESNLADATLTFIQPIDKNNCVGAGWYNFGLKDSYSESIGIVSYSRALTFSQNPFFAGASLKWLSKKYESDNYTLTDPLFAGYGYSKSNFAFDCGLLYLLQKNYSFGITLLDINQPNMNLNNDRLNIPIKYKLGVAYRGDDSAFTTEMVKKKDAHNFYTGLEKWFLADCLSIRGGIGIGSREYISCSIGATYRNSFIQIDYAFAYPLAGIKETSGNHSVSLTLPIQFTSDEKKKKTKVEQRITEQPKNEKIISYIVQQGDTLPAIAGKPDIYGNPGLWRKIYEANEDKIGPSYELTPGNELIIPRE